MEHGNKKHESYKHHLKQDASYGKTIVFLLVLVAVLTVFNQWQITGVKGAMSNVALNSASSGSSSATSSSGSASVSSVIPTGIPDIYGSELSISFDDVSASNRKKADATIGVLAKLDNQITLVGDDLDRYITIVSEISCEYCCGAESIIFSNGKPACGCAHSYAMRGIAKYMISEHGDEYTDDEVLEELGKWKTLFFPTQITAKAQVLEENGIEINYINLASNKYRGAEKGSLSGGGMVGGC